MIKCTKCLIEKESNEFYEKRKDRKQSLCKKCFNQYCIQRWSERKIEAVKYKGGCCIKCGYNKNYAALQFHHRDESTKDFEWVKMRLMKWENVLKELDKCDLLCSNCHAEFHNPNLKYNF